MNNHVAIIGTGFGGIATAVRLQQAGFDDFVLIDRAGDVGGVWRDNSYPGAAVDVKSHLYSLSFAANPDWRSVFASSPSCAPTSGGSPTSSISGVDWCSTAKWRSCAGTDRRADPDHHPESQRTTELETR